MRSICRSPLEQSNSQKHKRVNTVSPCRANIGRGGPVEQTAVAVQRKIIEKFISLGTSKPLRNGKGKTIVECARSSWVRVY
jgi:hypothetical protein